MPAPVRYVLTLLFVWSAGTLAPASAHATLVLGRFEVQPARPAAGEPVTLSLRLEDPTQVPTEDAVVFAELRPAARPEAEPVRAEFAEAAAGVYRATVRLRQPGPYRVRLRDQTYRQEEAQAALAEPLRVGGKNAAQDFVFPPTATGPASLRTWLLWLIGLPVVAALLVTVLVLTRGEPQAGPSDGAAPKA